MDVLFGMHLLLWLSLMGGGFGCCCWGYGFFHGEDCDVLLGEP